MTFKIAGIALLLILLATPVAAEITLSPEEGIVTGDALTISGTTTFSPGNRVHVEVQPLSFAPTNKTEPVAVTGYAETTEIVEEQGENRWSVVVDTTALAPGEYLVTAEVVGTDATDTAQFTLLPGPAETTEPSAPPSPEATPSPAVTATAVPEPTAAPGVGRDMAACVGGIIVALAIVALRLKK